MSERMSAPPAWDLRHRPRAGVRKRKQVEVEVTRARRPAGPIHPLHAFLLAAMVPLYLGGLLADLAYASSYQIQWANFAAWLIAGAMVFTGFALLWSLVDLLRVDIRRSRRLLSVLLLLAAFGLGLVDSFAHARDAYGAMPDGLILSAIVFALAAAAAWIGLSSLSAGEAK
jgi:uncharacterized membrane protein